LEKGLQVEDAALIDIVELSHSWFGVHLTPTQADIVHTIAVEKPRKLVISAFTRFGKSLSVAIAVLFYIRFNKNKKVVLIAPTIEQTNIIRNYLAEFIIGSPLADYVELDATRGIEGMKREVSKKRITFKNGSELRILSAEGTAQRLMGFGGDCIILDESCLISYDVYKQRISRMLGDSPDSMLVEIGNPWNKLNQMWEHWQDTETVKIHVPWTVGKDEGRADQVFIDEQRALLSPLEFKVLYDAEFPDDSEDTLIKWDWIQQAIRNHKTFSAMPRHSEVVIGADIAEGGKDFTVITPAVELENGKILVLEPKQYSEADTMTTTGHIFSMLEEFNTKKTVVDVIGVGKGVGDRLSELGYDVVHRKVSQSPTREAHRFLNQKAQYYWKLRSLFEPDKDGKVRIAIPDNKKLKEELKRYEIRTNQFRKTTNS